MQKFKIFIYVSMKVPKTAFVSQCICIYNSTIAHVQMSGSVMNRNGI